MNGPGNRYKLYVEGVEKPLDCCETLTVLQALIDGGIVVEADCGGRGTCDRCRVLLLRGNVAGPAGAPTAGERERVHLACRIFPRSDIVIRLANRAEAGAKGRMAAEFAAEGPPLLSKAVSIPRDGAAMTAVLFDDAVVAVEGGDTSHCLFGLAFDIGTTTVVGMLVDMNARKVVATRAELNPQVAYGADVISRIEAAASDEGLGMQARAIRECLDRIVGELCAAADVQREDVYAATIVGNTTMAHLLMAVPPAALAAKPYAAAFTRLAPFGPEAIGLGINQRGRVLLVPGIASFIGADTTAAVVAVDQDVATTLTLLVDLGTNGEIVWGDRNGLLACSTAAGPAFEGAHIRDGMRAAPGAIAGITIGDDVSVEVIGGGKAAGICGSGLVKAVAELLARGLVTASGRFDRVTAALLPAPLARRLRNVAGKWEFVLADGQDTVTGADIAITQDDIRQLQLVKASIRTGIEILLAKAAVEGEFAVYIAGAFGNYVDIDSAVAIGLLPGFGRSQFRSVGNAAGTGAVYALLSQDRLRRCYGVADKVRHVELAAEPDFQRRFLANLAFPAKG